jgi:tetratricopeptide (TPR) repeat protein
MERTPLPPAAEALFRAHHDRSTGWLTLVCGGREAKLYLQHGDLVGARLGFGHQTAAQALFAAGELVPPALDLLWSRGELEDAARLCEAAGVDPTALSDHRALASVRRVSQLAEEASFMPALVEVTFPRVRGGRAVRAAFEALPPVPPGVWTRCQQLEAAEPYLSGPEERAFLASLAEFRLLESVGPGQSALLRALEHAGLVEILDATAWEQRAGAEREEALRRAEEEGRREAARLALESARAAEEQRQTELKRRADAARRALEAARAAEDAWRRAQQSSQPDPALADTLSPRAPTTDPEYVAPPEAGIEGQPGIPTDPEFPVLSSQTPARIPIQLTQALDPAAGLEDEPIAAGPDITGKMGAPLEWPEPSGDEDTLVRAVRAAAGQTDPYAPPVPAGMTDPYASSLPAGRVDPPPPQRAPTEPFAGGEGPTTDPYAQALPRAASADAPTPPSGTEEIRTPPGGLLIDEPPVLEAEALLLPDQPPSPASLVEELSEALRRAGSEAPADLWSAPSTEAVGSKPAERTPLRLGPQGGEEADLWKLVEGTPAEAPASFEAALRQVDGQLESLAGLGGPASLDPEEPRTMPLDSGQLDALVRASFDSDTWTLEPEPPPLHGGGPDSGRISLAGLSGTPLPSAPPTLPEPSELSAERRRELLQQARAQVDTNPAASIPTPPPRSLEDAELADALEARHAALTRDPNRFVVLGLGHQAGRDEVKHAFIDLAKVFHPDRLPRSLSALRPKAARVFDAIREAQEYLLDDVRRAEHARVHAGAAAATAPDPTAASEALVAGELAMRKRTYPEAEAHFARAYAADPRPATLAAQAWAIYMDPARKADGPRARAMMVEALKTDPDCDRAHYQLGVIARVEGDSERAERHFREAVRANHRHLEAAQELRLLEMRKRPKKR